MNDIGAMVDAICRGDLTAAGMLYDRLLDPGDSRIEKYRFHIGVYLDESRPLGKKASCLAQLENQLIRLFWPELPDRDKRLKGACYDQ